MMNDGRMEQMTTVDEGTISTRVLPWQKLGTVLDEPLTPGEAIKRAGLDWTVDKQPLYTEVQGKLVQVESRFAIRRSSDDAILGTVGTHYETYQNAEAFDFLTDLVGDPDDAIIEAAGSVRKGRQVFVVVRFPGMLDDVLDGDEHELYAIIRTGHDGTKAVQVLLMPLRGLCMNSLGLSSFGREAPQRWSLHHTSTLQAKLAEARHTLEAADAYAEEYRLTAERLADSQIAENELRRIMERVLPERPQRAQVIDQVAARFSSSPTIQDRFRGTSYAALNAITEQTDWGQDRLTHEGRYHSILDGTSARVRNRAASLLLARS